MFQGQLVENTFFPLRHLSLYVVKKSEEPPQRPPFDNSCTPSTITLYIARILCKCPPHSHTSTRFNFFPLTRFSRNYRSFMANWLINVTTCIDLFFFWFSFKKFPFQYKWGLLGKWQCMCSWQQSIQFEKRQRYIHFKIWMEISTHTYRYFGTDIALYVNIGDFSAERNENDERGETREAKWWMKGGGAVGAKRKIGKGSKEEGERKQESAEKESMRRRAIECQWNHDVSAWIWMKFEKVLLVRVLIITNKTIFRYQMHKYRFGATATTTITIIDTSPPPSPAALSKHLINSHKWQNSIVYSTDAI